ncbi:MAG TPA: HD domain-containing protein [Parafilimonas sp.]|nr:HD domain-containing protein [Parafilimonas sp.]
MNLERTYKQTANEIMELYEKYGDEDYDGEPVSQTSHMIQCAMEAMAQGEDEELVLGSFLHDVGHLLKHVEATEEMGNFGVVNHEGLGAQYLKEKGFSARVCAMVENHVNAKRYLVATDETYQSKLSEASLQTLQWQGGPMDQSEVLSFEQHPFFEDIIKVRLWDEKAKKPDAVLIPISHFKTLITNYLKDKTDATFY